MFVKRNLVAAFVISALSCGHLSAQQATEGKKESREPAAKSLVEMLNKGDFDKVTKDFDAAMLKALPAAELKKTWDKVVAQAGAFQKQGATRQEKSGDYDVVLVTCEFAKAKLDARVVFDKAGKVAGLSFSPAQKPAPAGVEEVWEGILKAGGAELRLVFHLYKQKDGTYAATMDSPDQGAKGVPFDAASVKDDTVRLEIKSAAVVFEGKQDKEGKEIMGTFKQGGQSFPLVLKKAAKPK